MATHRVNLSRPPNMAVERFRRNGQGVNSLLWRRVAEATNIVAARMKKYTLILADSTFGPSAAGSTAWAEGYIQTGYQTNALVHYVGIIPQDNTYADPHLQITHNNVATAGGPTVADPFYYGARSASAETLTNEINHVAYKVTDATHITPNAEIELELTLENGARCAYWGVGEFQEFTVDDTLTGACDPTVFVDGEDITHDHIDAVLQAQTDLWGRNAAILGSASGITRTVTTTTYTSIFDGNTGTPAATWSGFEVDLTQFPSRTSSVDVRFAVRAKTSSGSTNDVRLVDQGGAVIGTLSSFGTSFSWQATTGTLDPTDTRLIFMMRSDGAATFQVSAVTVWCYL